MQTSLICCLALFCLTLTGRAAELPAKVSTNVPGAFGVVFGKPLPPKIITSTADSDLEVSVRIKPTTPSPFLNQYVARINPTNKAVYELQGWFETTDEAQKTEMFGKLSDGLAGKYGPLPPGASADATTQIRAVAGVIIDLAIINQSVVLTYTNSSQKKLADKALEERTAARTKKVFDATGL